jgi:anti-sigma regulatory factor (Ser/Thr protein kinase)
VAPSTLCRLGHPGKASDVQERFGQGLIMGVSRYEIARQPGPLKGLGAFGMALWCPVTLFGALAVSTRPLRAGASPRAPGEAAASVEQGRAEFDIPSDPRALRDLRLRTREVLLSWDLPVRQIEAAVLAAHELAVNALMHTSDAATLALILLDGRLRIEVSDLSVREPDPSTAEPGELEHGLGLTIVANLADAWGHRPAHNGKTV